MVHNEDDRTQWGAILETVVAAPSEQFITLDHACIAIINQKHIPNQKWHEDHSHAYTLDFEKYPRIWWSWIHIKEGVFQISQ